MNVEEENLEKSQGHVYVMIGLDCDRPRGAIIETAHGKEMARVKVLSLEHTRDSLNKLNLPRTYFICGQFLEAVEKYKDRNYVANLFDAKNSLVEIADHSYSHSLLKPIPTRADKTPINKNRIAEEFIKNSDLFHRFFGLPLPVRGYRAPLGYYRGLQDNIEVQKTLRSLDVLYVSTDLRDIDHSINPKLKDELTGQIRQPYFYQTGLLEIPTHGWQDTAFMGFSKSPLFESPPKNFLEICTYYLDLFHQAKELSIQFQKDIYLGLVLHPYNIALYDKEGILFNNLVKAAKKARVSFCRYIDCASQVISRTRS